MQPANPAPPRADQADALRDLLRRAERAGAHRRALLLHTDRLPTALAKPHHQRLARAAVAPLAAADRAESFELSRGRVVIVWRSRGDAELGATMSALRTLLADLPDPVPVGQLATLYDLPDQAPWLLDELTDPATAPGPHAGTAEPTRDLDPPTLARLEQALVQADLARFMRWRPIICLNPASLERIGLEADRLHGGADRPGARVGWELRYISARDIAANLCPDRRIKADPWLFRRLTRSFDRRMLSFLAGPQDLRHAGPFALHINVATILSAEFLRFDAALPGALRGQVILNLSAPDIMADAAAFTFARNFARSRGYRLLLRGATPSLLSLLDVAAAELDLIDVPLTQAVAADPDQLLLVVPDNITIVLSGIDTSTELEWAQTHNFTLLEGRAASALIAH